MPLPEIISRLRNWVSSGASPKMGPEDLADTFSFEDGIFRVTAPMAGEHFLDLGTLHLEDVVVLGELAAPDSFVCVLRGRDPATELWHQCAWVFFLENGQVQRAIRTLSAQVPPRPYDGSYPLREAP